MELKLVEFPDGSYGVQREDDDGYEHERASAK